MKEGVVTKGRRILGGRDEVEHWAKFNEHQFMCHLQCPIVGTPLGWKVEVLLRQPRPL